MTNMQNEVPAKGGFSFDLCKRNEMLMNKGGLKPPTYLKTGTTIVGLIFQVLFLTVLVNYISFSCNFLLKLIFFIVSLGIF